MSTLRLRDLIRKVRECKTAAEERAVIARESSAIRESFRNPDEARFVPRNVAKLMFMHMLGYPRRTSGRWSACELIAADRIPGETHRVPGAHAPPRRATRR